LCFAGSFQAADINGCVASSGGGSRFGQANEPIDLALVVERLVDPVDGRVGADDDNARVGVEFARAESRELVEIENLAGPTLAGVLQLVGHAVSARSAAHNDLVAIDRRLVLESDLEAPDGAVVVGARGVRQGRLRDLDDRRIACDDIRLRQNGGVHLRPLDPVDELRRKAFNRIAGMGQHVQRLVDIERRVRSIAVMSPFARPRVGFTHDEYSFVIGQIRLT
jgi:hypothetical protein